MHVPALTHGAQGITRPIPVTLKKTFRRLLRKVLQCEQQPGVDGARFPAVFSARPQRPRWTPDSFPASTAPRPCSRISRQSAGGVTLWPCDRPSWPPRVAHCLHRRSIHGVEFRVAGLVSQHTAKNILGLVVAVQPRQGHAPNSWRHSRVSD